MAGHGVMMRLRMLGLLPAAVLCGCFSNPKVDSTRLPDGGWALRVTQCNYGNDREPVIDEFKRQADKRCRKGWASDDLQVNDRVMLGTAVFGECPAVRVSTVVRCTGSKP
jgi:hypothetical protein